MYRSVFSYLIRIINYMLIYFCSVFCVFEHVKVTDILKHLKCVLIMKDKKINVVFHNVNRYSKKIDVSTISLYISVVGLNQ